MSSSDRGLIRGLALLALCLFGAACARGPGSEHTPQPRRLVPSWGLVGEPVPVRIEGERFLALATQHMGGREPVSVDARFEALLGEVPLEDVTLEDARTLRARVPAGLAPGWHTLTLRGPLGRVTLPQAWYASERTLARLGASAVLEQSVVVEGEDTRLLLTVENTGETAALAVTPVLRLAGEGRVERLSEPGPVDIAPLERASFAWELRGVFSGEVRFSLEFRGREEMSGMALEVAPVEVGPLRVRPRPGLLSARFTAPASVNVGQDFELALEVENQGGSAVLGVTPAELVPSVEWLTTHVSGPEPASVDIPAGGREVFRWRLTGAAVGVCSFRAGAGGTDPLEGARVEAPTVDSSQVSVQLPAELLAVLSAPSTVSLGRTFEVSLAVVNIGGATARGVLPSELLASSDAVEPVSTPGFTPVDVAGGSFATFSWSYRAARKGEVSFSTRVSGTDGNSGAPLLADSISLGPISIAEAFQLLEDPFGDGASFAQVVRYGGRLYLGPSRDGTGGVSVAPDGTGGQSFRFSFPRDTNGNVSQNDAAAPYPSIGVTGCSSDTPACGPDNENGRGLLFSGRVGTEEWLGLGGARSGGDMDYVYLTQDTDALLDMRYLDLSPFLGSQTRGISSALFFHNRLYLGFPDTGGSRPYFTVLYTLPTTAPGYDPSQGVDGADLAAQNMPGIGQGGTPQNKAAMQMIDTLAVFNERLYVANNGGCVRSTTPTPRSWGESSADWASCTPALPAWSERTSRETSKTADLEPADRAVPAMAVFQGRLYLARNTTVGPQLFVCNPETAGSATDCDAGDWSLVAPNSVGDTLLTQFDNPDNVALSLLAATANHLYVGFDNGAQGVVLLRASTATPLNQADFQGAGGCSAEQHPAGCEGLAGNGLGVGARRLFDSVTLGSPDGESLYLTTGDGSGPVRLFRLPD